MGLADRMSNVALRLIPKFGRTSAVTFSRQNVTTYSTSSLGNTLGTATTYTAYVAPVDFKLTQIDNVTIMTGEKMLWVPSTDTSGVSITPQVGDTVNLGTVYRVIDVTTYETESNNCAYLCKIGA